MLLKKQDSENYIESLFESSNLFKTLYVKKKKLLYVFFTRGGVVSYSNISEEIYNEFEKTDSQGAFIVQRIQKNSAKFPFRKEYKMKLFEINELTKEIDKLINEQNEF